MSYQVRHKEHGLFQGEFLGFGFWWPMSDMPEQGIAKFTLKEAHEFIAFLCSTEYSGLMKYNPEDFSIEEFDSNLDIQLQLQGVNKNEHNLRPN